MDVFFWYVFNVYNCSQIFEMLVYLFLICSMEQCLAILVTSSDIL